LPEEIVVDSINQSFYGNRLNEFFPD